MENRIRIRPHHLLCLLGFVGFGYNKKFIKNIAKISRNIKENPELEITLVMSWDDICSECPYFFDSKCLKTDNSEDILKEKERQVTSILNVDFKKPVKIKDLYLKIKNKFSLKEFDKLCKNCEWYSMDYCREGLKKLKRGG